jgi:integrase
MLKENNVRKGFFEYPQFDAVRTAAPEYLRPVLSFSFITGWRIPSEVLTLQWSQVDFLGGAVRLEPGTTKNGEGREFRLTKELRLILETQYAARPKDKICPWVFQRKGKPIGSFYKAWAWACYKAGLPCVVHLKRDAQGNIVKYSEGKKEDEPIIEKIDPQNIPHDFRRPAVRNLVRAGIPEAVAMKMTGHITRSVFERYNTVSERDCPPRLRCWMPPIANAKNRRLRQLRAQWPTFRPPCLPQTSLSC